MKSFKIMSPILCCLLLSSCGRRTAGTNNAASDHQTLSDGFPKNSTFFIEPIQMNDPSLSKILANKISNKLHEHGFVTLESDDADQAHYSIACTIATNTLPSQTSSKPTAFNHCLQLKVYAINNPNGPEQEELLWQGSAYVKNLDKNPGDILDYLLTCAFHHFGKNIQKH